MVLLLRAKGLSLPAIAEFMGKSHKVVVRLYNKAKRNAQALLGEVPGWTDRPER
jgi:hypothetical protein